jgi:hypothetical protein
MSTWFRRVPKACATEPLDSLAHLILDAGTREPSESRHHHCSTGFSFMGFCDLANECQAKSQASPFSDDEECNYGSMDEDASLSFCF